MALNDHDLSGMSMQDVENSLCECSFFAKGNDLLVFLDKSEQNRTTIIFLFKNDNCNGIIFKFDHDDPAIVDAMKGRLDSMYDERRTFSISNGSLRYPFVWFGSDLNVQMFTPESGVIEIRKTYARHDR